MAWSAVSCPQCGAPLPRAALWRAVKCESCGSLIAKAESIVTRDSFRQAWNRAKDSAGPSALACGGFGYRLLQTLGVGEISEVHLACRVDPHPFLAAIKLSSSPAAASLYASEAQVLRDLQNLDGEGLGAWFSRLLPEVIFQGVVDGSAGKQALVLRHPAGFWGSLAALNERFPNGLDPRHAVWIWRRMLDLLRFVHNHGWSHGSIRPEHALVHPRDHGVRLIGWSSAKRSTPKTGQAADLCRAARVIQVLLCGAGSSGDLPGSVPPGLASLISRAARDLDFCRAERAEGLDALLQAEAKTAFGPPAFVRLEV